MLLGQGCSSFKGPDHVISVPVPNFKLLKSFKKITVPKITIIKSKTLSKEDLKTGPSQENISLAIEKEFSRTQRKKRNFVRDRKNNSRVKSHQEVINKNLNVVFSKIKNIKPQLKTKHISKVLPPYKEISALNNQTGFNHYGFKVASEVKLISFSKAFEGNLINTNSDNTGTLLASNVKPRSDHHKETVPYSPTDPKILTNFKEMDTLDIRDFVTEKKSSTTEEKDEPLMIDYSKSKDVIQAQSEKLELSKKPVTLNIKGPSKKLVDSLIKEKLVKQPLKVKGIKRDTKQSKVLSEEIIITALHADVGKGFDGPLENISFAPSYDPYNEVTDVSDGEIRIDYSLSSQSGILKGSLSKRHFVRTAIEVPLGIEYSKLEVPLISKDSLATFIDNYSLVSYGGYFLVDLANQTQDLEIEHLRKNGKDTYERRFFLNEKLEVIKDETPARYLFFVGIDPGLLNITYLGINGQETSRLIFIAPDQIAFEYAEFQRPTEYTFETKIRHTLGKTAKLLDLDKERIVQLETGENPTKDAPGRYILNTSWKIQGKREYVEIGHLEDSVFVGFDGNQEIELPSQEFISELLKNHRMSELRGECVLQVNFSKKLKGIKLWGENNRGPSTFEKSFLDKDGVFSPELSPLTEKMFLLGYEEGVYDILIEYEDNTQDYLKSFCSTSSYLIEQL